MENWLVWLVGGVLAIAFGAAVWWELQPHPTFTLDARDWECSDTDTHLTPVIVGKLTMMQPRTVCVEYRKGS